MSKVFACKLALAVAGFALIAAASVCYSQSPPTAQTALTGKVKEVVDRSKATRATYSIYVHNWLKAQDGTELDEWSGEFNDGVRHRIENPHLHAIADCRAITGVAVIPELNLRKTGPQVAQESCGIATNVAYTGATYLGVVLTPCGDADRIKLVEKDNVRTYDVTKEGIVVGETWRRNGGDQALTLKQTVVAVVPTVPSHDMFDEASLQTTFTPDQFRISPKPFPWTTD